MYEKIGRTEYSPARALQMRVNNVDDVRPMVVGSFNIYVDTVVQAQVLMNLWADVAETIDAKVAEIFSQITTDPGDPNLDG